MSRGFRNSIFGSFGDLVIDTVQSPNYVAGVSGWQIRSDGSAEFNDITARGNVTANQLILPSGATTGQRIALAGQSITQYDSSNAPVLLIESNDDNIWLQSLYAIIFGANPLADPNADAYEIFANLIGANNKFVIARRHAGGNSAAIVITQAVDPVSGITSNLVQFPPRAGGSDASRWQFGNGTPGGYYYEEYTRGAVTLNTGTTTTLTGGTRVISESDYNGGASTQYDTGTGQWIAPDDGEYILIDEWRSNTNATAAGRTIHAFSSLPALGGTVYKRNDKSVNNGNPFDDTLIMKRYFTRGTSVYCSAFQNAVAAGITTVTTDTNAFSFKRDL